MTIKKPRVTWSERKPEDERNHGPVEASAKLGVSRRVLEMQELVESVRGPILESLLTDLGRSYILCCQLMSDR